MAKEQLDSSDNREDHCSSHDAHDDELPDEQIRVVMDEQKSQDREFLAVLYTIQGKEESLQLPREGRPMQM